VKIFSALYDRVLAWTQHPRAPSILASISFAESVIFPIPPDVMLAPMAMMQPQRAWFFAMLTTVSSVLGALVGYALGYFAFEALVLPWVEWSGNLDKLEVVKQWFVDYGFWIVFIAGFSPIPYKLFTVSGGMMGIALVPFLLASFVSRGLRFFLVAGLMKFGGPKMALALKRYVDALGWMLIILAVIAYVLLR